MFYVVTEKFPQVIKAQGHEGHAVYAYAPGGHGDINAQGPGYFGPEYA
jgi:hypothetical protein